MSFLIGILPNKHLEIGRLSLIFYVFYDGLWKIHLRKYKKCNEKYFLNYIFSDFLCHFFNLASREVIGL